MRTPSAGALVPLLYAAPTLDRIPVHTLSPRHPRYETCWLPLLADGGATKARLPVPYPHPSRPLLALRPFLRQPSSRLPPSHHLLAQGCAAAAGRRVGVGRPPTLARLIHRGLRGAVRQAHRPRQWRAPPPRHRRAAPLPASCASTPSPHNFPLTPPPPPAPRRPSLWGAKLCRRLLILILRRRLQVYSPKKQSPCGSSATQTSRAPCLSAAHATSSPCMPVAWAGPIVSCLPPQVCAARQVHPLPGRLRFAAIVRHRLRCRAAGKATAAAPAAPPPPPPPPPPSPPGHRQQRLAPALHLRRWSSTTKYHCRTTLLPTFSRRPPSGAPPSPPPPPPRIPRRVMHRCLPPPSGTRCTCT